MRKKINIERYVSIFLLVGQLRCHISKKRPSMPLKSELHTTCYLGQKVSNNIVWCWIYVFKWTTFNLGAKVKVRAEFRGWRCVWSSINDTSLSHLTSKCSFSPFLLLGSPKMVEFSQDEISIVHPWQIGAHIGVIFAQIKSSFEFYSLFFSLSSSPSSIFIFRLRSSFLDS